MTAPEIVEEPPLAQGAEVVPGYPVADHLRRGEDYDTYIAWSTARYSHCVVKTVRPDRARAGGRAAQPWCARAGCCWVPAIRTWCVPTSCTPRAPVRLHWSSKLSQARRSSALLAEHARLPQPLLGHLGQHLCSAARYLHSRGHLHLDIKPSNIIVSGGAARLIDLGLSRPPGPCRAGVGTARNMAPEQALGEPVSAATDTWGIGLVLYEAATGHRPFGDGGDMWSCRCGEDDCSWSEPRYLQLERRAPKVRARRRLPVEVAAAIDACLDRDPARRPTLDALGDALGGLLP